MLNSPEGKLLFAARELQDPDTGTIKLAPGFGDSLVKLRLAYGHPMIVNSCCRSAAYNNSISGHPRSLHVWDDPYHDTGGTAAIDIAMTDSTRRWWLVYCALRVGWSVGVAKTFLHLDRRIAFGLPQVMYVY